MANLFHVYLSNNTTGMPDAVMVDRATMEAWLAVQADGLTANVMEFDCIERMIRPYGTPGGKAWPQAPVSASAFVQTHWLHVHRQT